MEKNKCPYCKTDDCVPTIAFEHAKNYGNTCYIIKCKQCKALLDLTMKIYVSVGNLTKTDCKQADWSDSRMND